MTGGEERRDWQWVVNELQRVARLSEAAQRTADSAISEIATHERECALRYTAVAKGLGNIDQLFDKLGTVTTVVYTGVGIMLAVPALIGIVVGLKELLGH